MKTNPAKKRIVTAIEVMKGFELAARDLHRKIGADPRVHEQPARNILRKIS